MFRYRSDVRNGRQQKKKNLIFGLRQFIRLIDSMISEPECRPCNEKNPFLRKHQRSLKKTKQTNRKKKKKNMTRVLSQTIFFCNSIISASATIRRLQFLCLKTDFSFSNARNPAFVDRSKWLWISGRLFNVQKPLDQSVNAARVRHRHRLPGLI